jgi:hypothetical protein
MSRSPDPERIFAAKRAATLQRLVNDHGIPREWATAWLDSYEGGAADLHDLRRDRDFWANAFNYTLNEYQAGHRPPSPPDVASDERDPRL